MEKSTKVMGAAGAVAAAAAAAVGVAVARRKNAEPEVYRVRSTPDGWVVSVDGGGEPLSTHGTKKEALSAARKTAGERAPSTLVLHYADGREQKRLTYAGG